MDADGAITVSFLTLALVQLWHVFNMRDAGSGLWRNEITRNPYIWGALLLCAGLLVAAVYAPGISAALRLRDPGLAGWALVLGMSLAPLLIAQAVRPVVRRFARRNDS